jgi:hypothetical protein
VILIDANILLIDSMYSRDANFVSNAEFLSVMSSERIDRGMTLHGLLEVVGKRSFNVIASNVAKLPGVLCAFYGLKIFPDPATHPGYAGIAFSEIVSQMERKMSLGDAVMARQIEQFAARDRTRDLERETLRRQTRDPSDDARRVVGSAFGRSPNPNYRLNRNSLLFNNAQNRSRNNSSRFASFSNFRIVSRSASVGSRE